MPFRTQYAVTPRDQSLLIKNVSPSSTVVFVAAQKRCVASNVFLYW